MKIGAGETPESPPLSRQTALSGAGRHCFSVLKNDVQIIA